MIDRWVVAMWIAIAVLVVFMAVSPSSILHHVIRAAWGYTVQPEGD